MKNKSGISYVYKKNDPLNMHAIKTHTNNIESLEELKKHHEKLLKFLTSDKNKNQMYYANKGPYTKQLDYIKQHKKSIEKLTSKNEDVKNAKNLLMALDDKLIKEITALQKLDIELNKKIKSSEKDKNGKINFKIYKEQKKELLKVLNNLKESAQELQLKCMKEENLKQYAPGDLKNEENPKQYALEDLKKEIDNIGKPEEGVVNVVKKFAGLSEIKNEKKMDALEYKLINLKIAAQIDAFCKQNKKSLGSGSLRSQVLEDLKNEFLSHNEDPPSIAFLRWESDRASQQNINNILKTKSNFFSRSGFSNYNSAITFLSEIKQKIENIEGQKKFTISQDNKKQADLRGPLEKKDVGPAPKNP